MEDAPGTTAPNGLREYLDVLWRRRWTVIVTALVFVAASVVYSLVKTPEYEATAQLELTPQVSSAVLQANNATINSTAGLVDVPTDTQVLESSSVENRVRAKLPQAPPVSVSQVGTTDVVNVSVRSESPKLAAKAANLYATVYIAVQQYQSAAALSKAVNAVQTHVDSLQSQIDSLSQQMAGATGPTAQSLQARINSLEQSQTTLNQQISQYQTAASLSTGGGEVVSSAKVPTSPVVPKPAEYALIALIVGLVVGAGVALLKDYLDEGIRSIDDLQRVLGDIPPLGVVPRVANWKEQGAPYLVSIATPKGPASEAYKSIRTSIQFLSLDRSLKTIQVTSPKSYDGKTTTIANLAIMMAAAGQRVTVIDCDLRRPRIHAFFGISNEFGFTSVLLGQVGLESALQSVPDFPTLRVLSAGPIPPNPSELLSGHSAQQLIEECREGADIVLIDSPPVLPVTDAVALAGSVDAVVLVASVGNSNQKDVSHAVEMLRRIDSPPAGFVLNRVLEGDTYAYYRYAYGGGLADTPDAPDNNGRKPAHSASGRRTKI